MSGSGDRLTACPLTVREVAHLQARADGLSIRQVASRFGVGEETIKSSLRRMRPKLVAAGYDPDLVASSVGLVAVAMRAGWIS